MLMRLEGGGSSVGTHGLTEVFMLFVSPIDRLAVSHRKLAP
jgi:hypothetical protein